MQTFRSNVSNIAKPLSPQKKEPRGGLNLTRKRPKSTAGGAKLINWSKDSRGSHYQKIRKAKTHNAKMRKEKTATAAIGIQKTRKRELWNNMQPDNSAKPEEIVDKFKNWDFSQSKCKQPGESSVEARHKKRRGRTKVDRKINCPAKSNEKAQTRGSFREKIVRGRPTES